MIRRKINWTVLAFSIVILASTATGLYLLHGWQLSRLATALLAVADGRETEQKWDEASAHLDHYLRVHPEDVVVRGRLATVYAKGASSRSEKARATELHYRALAAGPTEDATALLRASLARLLVESGRFTEAEHEARKVVEQDPDDPEANRALALALFAQWENGSLTTVKLDQLGLITTAEKARKLNPSDALLAEVTAAFYRSHASVVSAEFPKLSDTERSARADACLDDLVTQNIQDPKALLARYRYRLRYQLAGHDDDIAKALELAPQDEEVLLTAAKSAQLQAIETRDSPQPQLDSKAFLERSRELYFKLYLNGENLTTSLMTDVYLGLGEVHLALGQLDQAVSIWRNGVQRFATPTIQIALLSRIVDGLLQSDRTADASESLKAIDGLIGGLGSAVPRDERLALVQSQDLRRASWHMLRNEAALAIPLLQDVVARQASGTSGNAVAAFAWNLLGRANAQLNEWGEAAVAFDRASPLDPKSHSMRLAAGFAWLQAGRPEMALQRAEQSLAIQPTADAILLLASSELEQQRRLPAKQRAFDRVERSLAALDQDPNVAIKLSAPWRIDFLRADLVVFRGQFGDELRGRKNALGLLERAESKYSDAAEFWRLACLAYQRLGDSAGADRALAKYEELTPSAADRAIAKSRLIVLRNDTNLAQQTLEKAASQATAAEQLRLRSELVQMSFGRGDLAGAERLLSVDAQHLSSDVNVLRRACELALQRGDATAAKKWQEKLAAAGSLGTWWARYYQATQIVTAAENGQSPSLREALEEVAKLTVIRPHWPVTHTLRGMIEQRQERLDEAVRSYEQAIQLGESRLSVFEQLVGLLDRLNRTADAERYLSRLESFMPFSQRLTEIATNHELRRDNPHHAIEIARAAVAKRSNDAYAHLWLARLLLLNKDFAESESAFKKALELAPDDVRAWNGLFTFYVRSGNLQQARQALDDIRDKAKLSVADRSFVLAQGFEMLGDWQSATTQYEAAAQAAPHQTNVLIRLAVVQLRSDPKRAEQSLRKALELEPGLPVARRMLAALLAARGDKAQIQEVESLLGKKDPTTAEVPVEDRRLNALLLAQYGDSRDSARAAEMLEGLVAKPQETAPGDRLILAQIYESQARTSPNPEEADAKRKSAFKHLLAAASQADAQPAQLESLIEYLIRNSQNAEAGKWLDKLELHLESRTKDEPNSLAKFIELRMRHQSGDRCQKWLDRLAAADSDPLRPTAIKAAWLGTQGRSSEIESLVEPVAAQLVAKAPDNRERSRCARLVGDLYTTTSLPQQAERWYRSAAADDPNQFPSLVRALALGSQTAEAIRLCRDQSQKEQTGRPAAVLASVLTEAAPVGEYGREIDAFLSSALQQHDKDVQLLYTVATLRAVQSRFEEAIGLYRSVLKLQPKNIAVLNNLAMILADSPASRDESLQLIDQAIEIAGQQPGLLDTKGAILVYQGRAQQAVFLLEAAAREAGKDSRHKFHLAAAYHGVGDMANAKQNLEDAIADDLEKQPLTATDRRMLVDLKAALIR